MSQSQETMKESFGAEAINTIVQQMENYRDEVIVIFAGYPDKMQAFIDQNEGLSSRIAFHLNFPDYNADELTMIMDLMLEQQGYRIEGEVGEHVGLIVVPDDDWCKANNFNPEAVKATVQKLCNEQLAEYKVPRKIIVRPEPFELTSTMKVKRVKYEGTLDE